MFQATTLAVSQKDTASFTFPSRASRTFMYALSLTSPLTRPLLVFIFSSCVLPQNATLSCSVLLACWSLAGTPVHAAWITVSSRSHHSASYLGHSDKWSWFSSFPSLQLIHLLSLYKSLRRFARIFKTGSFSWRHLKRPPSLLFFLVEVHLIPLCLLILFHNSDHLNFSFSSCGSSLETDSDRRHSKPTLRFIRTLTKSPPGCSTFLSFQYISTL